MRPKLLLADDSVTIQRVIELTFADEDVQVVAVSDGDQAIAQLESDPPDIVLADIGMPGRDGYQVAEYVKKSPKLSHVPVLLLTGAFEPVDEARVQAIGCAGVLAKPFEPQLVITRVRELLGGNGHGAPTSAEASAPAAPAPNWPPASSGAGTGAAAPSNADVEGLDSYFDRLDQAFASRAAAEPAARVPDDTGEAIDWFAHEQPAGPAQPKGPEAVEPEPAPSAPSAEVPVSYASPAPQALPPEVASADQGQPAGREPRAAGPVPELAPSFAGPPPPLHASVPAPALRAPETTGEAQLQLPSLADAFAALLAAEQASPEATAAHWPVASPAAAPVPASPIAEDVIEEVVRRVLNRLTDRVIRDTSAEIVSTVAERLVREEIDRIKASVA